MLKQYVSHKTLQIDQARQYYIYFISLVQRHIPQLIVGLSGICTVKVNAIFKAVLEAGLVQGKVQGLDKLSTQTPA